MNAFIQRLMLSFLGLFGLGVVAVAVYAIYWQEPARRCEQAHHWWDASDRVCAMPIYLPNLTHRPIGSPPLKATSPKTQA